MIKRLALSSKHITRSEVYSIMKHMKFMLHRIMQMISNNDKKVLLEVRSDISIDDLCFEKDYFDNNGY